MAFVIRLPCDFQSGSARVPFDLALTISRAYGTDPVFIKPDMAERFLARHSGAVAVGINLADNPFAEKLEKHKRFVSIGIGSCQLYTYPCRIFLSPTFTPLEDQYRKAKQTICYNYLPSRMVPAPEKVEQRTIAIYMRGGWIRELETITEILHRDGFRFLVATGPNSSCREELNKHFSKMANTEICFWDNIRRKECSAWLDAAFARASAIIVSNDTVSTLSDAVAMNKPVFLLTAESEEELMETPYPWSLPDPNRNVQRYLLGQDRLRVLSYEAVKVDWKPTFCDEWHEIGLELVSLIGKRRRTPRQMKAYALGSAAR